jgi:hypothetical protein
MKLPPIPVSLISQQRSFSLISCLTITQRENNYHILKFSVSESRCTDTRNDTPKNMPKKWHEVLYFTEAENHNFAFTCINDWGS